MTLGQNFQKFIVIGQFPYGISPSVSSWGLLSAHGQKKRAAVFYAKIAFLSKKAIKLFVVVCLAR